MKKYLILVVSLAALGVLGYGQTAADQIKAGDEAYAQFNDQKALEHYQEALKLEPEHYEALWKTSRALVDIADVIPEPVNDEKERKLVKERKLKLYTDATDYATKAITANPNDTWGHFQYSAAFGKELLLLSKKKQVNNSMKIKAEIEKAIELDSKNDLAYHALGRWYKRIAEISGVERTFGSIFIGSIPEGTFEDAEKYLKKAVELRPEFVNHHLELGKTYVALKKYDLAAAEFQKAIDLPKTTSKDDTLKAEAQAELAKIKGKTK